MSARAMGSGTISFGLVTIPVKLYSSTESRAGISFNWLHRDCGSRLKQQYVCAKDGEKVGRDDMERGYEFAKGQYVTFTEEELKDLQENPTQTIDITEFVPVTEVDPIYFSRPYYLGPDKSDRAYRLLSEALTDTGRVALAKYRSRGKQYLVMLRPYGPGLVMQQLLYPHEIRSFDEVPIGEAEVKDAELQLARQLIEQASSDTFRPEEYRDEVYERVRGLIEKKVEGQEVSFAPPEEPQAQIIDLMDALKASLSVESSEQEEEQAEEATGTEGRRPARRSTKTRKTSRRKSSKG